MSSELFFISFLISLDASFISFIALAKALANSGIFFEPKNNTIKKNIIESKNNEIQTVKKENKLIIIF